MSADFKPKLSALQEPQRRLWSELGDVPQDFVLYGGTAVALHLGHRQSVDFDFLSPEQFDPDQLYEAIPLLQESKVLQKSTNTLSCLVDRDGSVQVSFFGVPKVSRIRAPLVAAENHVRVATLLDLAGMKTAVVQKRAEAKDYLDLDAIIKEGGIDLSTALAAGKAIYGASFSPEISLKALSYFEDGNLGSLPPAVRDRLAAAVKAVDLDRLPNLTPENDV
jgi:hypothetical protein